MTKSPAPAGPSHGSCTPAANFVGRPGRRKQRLLCFFPRAAAADEATPSQILCRGTFCILLVALSSGVLGALAVQSVWRSRPIRAVAQMRSTQALSLPHVPASRARARQDMAVGTSAAAKEKRRVSGRRTRRLFSELFRRRCSATAGRHVAWDCGVGESSQLVSVRGSASMAFCRTSISVAVNSGGH